MRPSKNWSRPLFLCRLSPLGEANAGKQTPTVAVRALAVGELIATNALRIVGKETLVGGINGVIFAVLIG